MRAVVQRVTRASVHVQGSSVGRIGRGMVVLLGIARDDGEGIERRMAERIVRLRIFDDEHGRMHFDVAGVGGALLCVSQFTLYGDVRRGRRPSFDAAADAAVARPLYEEFVRCVRELGVACETGIFGAEMQVELVNDGPVTLVIDSNDLERPRRA